MFPKVLPVIALLLLTTLTAAQSVADKNATEQHDKLRKEAVAFLRETLTDVNSMRSVENRISFTSELAGLMWFYDEREARTMYIEVIQDFKDLIARYDSQMNEMGPPPEDEVTVDGPMRFFLFDPTDRMRLMRKFTVAMGVRQQIVASMSEHDPDLAFSFYYDTLTSVANAGLRKTLETRDSHFESQLLTRIAEKNVEKAAKLAKRSIEKGVNYQHIELLKKIHATDPDRGADFATALLSRVKDEKTRNLYILSGLIRFGQETLDASKNPGGKRAVYTLAELRELAELIAQEILNSNSEDYNGLIHTELVEKYLPGRAAQIRAKFKTARTDVRPAVNTATLDPQDPEEYEAYAASVATNSSSNSNMSGAVLPAQERELAEQRMFEDIQGLATRQLPAEERQRIIAQARKIISQTPGRDRKIPALSLLAAQVASLGDKELAAEIMRDAERLVNPSPKHYQDFILTWMLASGYAVVDPAKSFPLLEETIARANETLAAFVKIGEFMDANEEMIVDGEVQLGAFGGQMVKGLTSELNMADATIQMLAKADFGKTKALTNRFDRAEIRVLAKMMVLRAVLDPGKKPESLEGEVSKK